MRLTKILWSCMRVIEHKLSEGVQERIVISTKKNFILQEDGNLN